MNLRKLLLKSMLFMMFSITMKAQVTLGMGKEAEKGAILDIKTQEPNAANATTDEGGVLLPRVELVNELTLEPFVKTNDPDWVNAATSKIKERHTGLVVYNVTKTSGFEQGTYIWEGDKWLKVKSKSGEFFYMPSIAIDTSVLGFGTKNLYDLYKDQFMKPMKSSTGAPASIPYLPKATDLYYYITYYDQSVIDIVNLDENGNMIYNIKGLSNSLSFMNIVFVIK